MNESKPCPSCGHCPCCGRGGYQTYPYYQPYPTYPKWYYNTGPTSIGVAPDTVTGQWSPALVETFKDQTNKL